MAGVEILLLVNGVVFYIASFFIKEKLGPGELDKIGELSNEEIQKVMETELKKSTSEIEGMVSQEVEEALLKSERSMEKECNEKIMAISEFSDTVLETMNKTHNEIMFLYSMLNDKHTELTRLSGELQELAKDLEKKDEKITTHLAQNKPISELRAEPLPQIEEPPVFKEGIETTEYLSGDDFDEIEDSNHNDAILALHKQGKSSIDIARELTLGLGEVQLVIGLYEGKRKQ